MRSNLYLQYTDKPKFEGVLTSPQKNNSAYNDGGVTENGSLATSISTVVINIIAYTN